MARRSVCLTVETDGDGAFVDAWERLSRICAAEILSGRRARVWDMEDSDYDEEEQGS